MSLLNFFGFTESAKALSFADTDDRWYGAVARKTTSGIRVDEVVAFNYSVCWAATRLLAGTSGWLPFNLHKRLSGGGAEIDKRHRVHRLIHDQPNQDMGAMMFRARSVNHQVNWGNTFSEIERNRGGQPIALHPIHPARIPVSTNITRRNGRLIYLVNQTDGKKTEIVSENMFHVASIISDDGIIGKGVIAAARETIGKAMGTQIHGSSALSRGGAPPLALQGAKFKTKEDQEDFRRQINEVHGGPENAGKWLILPKETEVKMLGYSLEDSQFIESMQFDIEEMSRWYGVPPHLVGHLLRATFNNIEELGISFVKYSLILWLKLWEQEVWRKLLTPEEQETHYAKFNVDALERGNLATRTEAGVKKFFNGFWTINQWADKEDENPVTETVEIDGKTVNLGDVRFVQQAMIPLTMAAKGEGLPPAKVEEPAKPEAPPDEPKDDPGLSAATQEALAGINTRIAGLQADGLNGEAQELRDQIAATRAAQQQLATAMLRDVMSRMVSLEVNAVKRAAEKPERFLLLAREFYDKNTMERSLTEPLGAWLASKADERNASELSRAMSAAHVVESLKQLDALLDCQADELAGKVDECVSKWHEERVGVTL